MRKYLVRSFLVCATLHQNIMNVKQTVKYCYGSLFFPISYLRSKVRVEKVTLFLGKEMNFASNREESDHLGNYLELRNILST